MFSVGIIEGFPVLERQSTRKTGDSVFNFGVDETSSSQVLLVGAFEELWPISKAGITFGKIGIFWVFPFVPV